LVLAIINVYVNELNNKQTAETYLAQLRKPTSQVLGLIQCQNFKEAYRLAVKVDGKSVTLVQKIYEEAIKHSKTQVADMCDQYLNQHAKEAKEIFPNFTDN